MDKQGKIRKFHDDSLYLQGIVHSNNYSTK